MNLRRYLDPDRNWRSPDKLEHFAFGVVLCWLFTLAALSGPAALWWTAWSAVAYEAGQTDTAASAGLLGKPGFGFGLLDIAAALAGALVYLAFRGVL